MDPISLLPRLISPIKDAILFFKKKWWPPKFGYGLAHSNILEIIGPYVPKDKVIELLGQPHRIQEKSCAYRFENALLQVNYDKDFDFVESVALVSVKMRWPNRLQIFPFDFTIGASSFEEIREYGEEAKSPIKMDVEFSSKYYCLSCECFYGHPGRYFYYNFALFAAATFPSVEMPEAKYESIDENEMYGPAYLLSTDSKFNGVCISTKEGGGFAFSFQMFN